MLAGTQWGVYSRKIYCNCSSVVFPWYSPVIGIWCRPLPCLFRSVQAFDSVLHLPLLQKLSDCGLNQHILQWITCYLSDREQYVVSGNLCVQVLIYRGSKGKDIEFQSDQDFDIGVKNFLCSKSMNALRYDETWNVMQKILKHHAQKRRLNILLKIKKLYSKCRNAHISAQRH